MALLGGGLVGLIALACAVWVIYDVASNQKKMDSGQKVLWIILAILFSILTAIIYYLVVKK
jgi:prolipoprotein diacylglyceryltransferase